MKLSKQQIIPFLILVLAVIIIGLWAGLGNSVQKPSVTDSGYSNKTEVTVTPVQTPACHGYFYPVLAGGDVYLGEGCLNVSAGISSGQVISWYKNGRNSENDTPDESRIVRDARNFYVNPDEVLGFEGPWYAGTTDKVAFVVKDVTLDSRTLDVNSADTGSPSQTANAQGIPPASFESSGKLDAGIAAIVNSTNQIDYIRVWVVLEEPSERSGVPGANNTMEVNPVSPRQQPGYYLNYTKPVVDYVRGRGFIVDYIGQASPSLEVLAPPGFMKELAERPDVRKIVSPRASHPLIKEMLQRKPDETIRVMVSLTKPPEVTRFLHTTWLTEEQIQEYYSKNRVFFKNHTRPILDLLEKENISIDYIGPYPTGGFRAEIPVHLIEEFNARPEVVYMEREIPAHLI